MPTLRGGLGVHHVVKAETQRSGEHSTFLFNVLRFVWMDSYINKAPIMSSCLHLSAYLTTRGETIHRLSIHVELSIR